MTSFLILHQMANDKRVTRDKIWAVVLGYYKFFDAVQQVYTVLWPLVIAVQQVYKQKVKHLLYEHQNNISELKAESTVALKLAQDDHRGDELDLRRDKRSLKVELKEQQLSHEDVIKDLKKVGTGLMLNVQGYHRMCIS